MKRIYKVLIFLLCVFLIFAYLYILYIKYNEKKRSFESENKQILIENKQTLLKNKIAKIKSAYSKYVITNKNADLYKFENNKYVKSGNVSKGYEFTLVEKDITTDDEFFLIDGLDYYINYKDVDKIDRLTIGNVRYKKYVHLNKNIITSGNVTLYKDKDTFINIDCNLNTPIIINDKDIYYFEFNNDLYYINKKDVKEIKSNKKSTSEIRNNIRVLTYHTIFNKKTQKCKNTVICHPIEQFDSHMKYLSDNNYLTLTMNELEMFLDKKIQVPKKSIVVTLDDGKYAINAVNIVEKYKVNATYFIITSKYDVSKIKTTYMNFQSHTHNLHNNYKCAGGNQGGQLLCETDEKILKDLKTNKEKLGGDVFAFAYPFFDYNDRAIKLLKQSGFRLAFVGQADTDGYSNYKTDRFKLRRKTIFSTDSVDKFISYLK